MVVACDHSTAGITLSVKDCVDFARIQHLEKDDGVWVKEDITRRGVVFLFFTVVGQEVRISGVNLRLNPVDVRRVIDHHRRRLRKETCLVYSRVRVRMGKLQSRLPRYSVATAARTYYPVLVKRDARVDFRLGIPAKKLVIRRCSRLPGSGYHCAVYACPGADFID